MKRVFSAALFLVGVLGMVHPAKSSPLDCELIHDADQRHYCRAVAIPDKAECEFIKNHDVRMECRARVR